MSKEKLQALEMREKEADAHKFMNAYFK